MKFSSTVIALAGALPFAQAFRKGFNIGANKADGSCKSTEDWGTAFEHMKALPGGFNNVRVYASSDCNTLQNAVPAANKHGIQLLVGVWAEDEAHYNAEKQALLKAIHNHGVDWISAISVGSEDLYRGDTNAEALAGQIKDVRGMMTTVKGGSSKMIGHVDTWTAWVNGANTAVIKACDFIGLDGYPYFQNAKISNARNVFYKSLDATKKAVAATGHKAPIWVTETGWPVTGPNSGSAVPSKANAQKYWKKTICSLFPKYNTFVYTLADWNASPSFGVVGPSSKPIYDLHC